MAEKSLNGDKQRKGNRKRSSHKANSDNKNKVTTILGNSRISEVEDYRIFKKLSNQKHVVVKSFASLKLNVCLLTQNLKSLLLKRETISYHK